MQNKWEAGIEELSQNLGELCSKIPEISEQDLQDFEEKLAQLNLESCPPEVRHHLKEPIEKLYAELRKTLAKVNSASAEVAGAFENVQNHKKAACAYTKAYHAK